MVSGGCLFRDRFSALVLVLVLVAGLIIPHIVAGQITPDADGPVDYGPTITTDRAKLYACYSLIRQVIDEYNRQSAIASGNVEKYADKFRAYAKDYFGPTLGRLLGEYGEIKGRLMSATYTQLEWRAISRLDPENYSTIYGNLFGNRTKESGKPTLAVYEDFDQLKLVVLDDVIGIGGVDPYEDFYTDYTEYDEGDDVTISSGQPYKISWVDAYPRSMSYWVYDDKGVDHFDGDFEHLIEFNMSDWSSYQLMVPYMLANEIGDGYAITMSNGDFLAVRFYGVSGVFYIYLSELVAGTRYDDIWDGADEAILYYVTIDRADSTDDLTCYVCETAHYGEGGSSLKATLTLDLHEKEDFRYIYGLASWDTGASYGSVDGFVQNLDLQEGAPPTATPWCYGYIIGG